MGATQASPSRADLAELQELRRRAYGPDADIGGDLVACARLRELEGRCRAAAAHEGKGDLHPVGSTDAVLAPARTGEALTGELRLGARPAEIPSAPGVAPSSSPVLISERPAPVASRPSTKPAPRWWQRRMAIVVDVGVAVAAIGVLVSALTPPSTDVMLHPRTDIPADASAELSRADELNYLGIPRDDVRLYDEFRGLNIWSGPRGTSSTCMFVTTDARPRWRVDCAPWSGEPTIDLIKYRESSRLSGIEAWGDMPVGSMIRLVLRDGAVLAQTVEAPATVAGAAR